MTTISQLPAATLPLAPNNLMEVEQDGKSYKAPVDAISGGSGGSGAVQSTGKISLSSAQILASAVTGVPCIAAPGAGRAIGIVASYYTSVYGTVAYSGGDGHLLYGSVSGPLADQGDNAVFTFSVSSWQASAGGNGNNASLAAVENMAVVWGVNTEPGDLPYTGGNGTGSITALYTIVTL